MDEKKDFSIPPKSAITPCDDVQKGQLLGLLMEAGQYGYAEINIKVHQGKMVSAELSHRYRFL